MPTYLVKHNVGVSVRLFFLSFFKDFIHLFLERGEGKEKERKTLIGYLSHALKWGLALNPDLCPDWELNQ